MFNKKSCGKTIGVLFFMILFFSQFTAYADLVGYWNFNHTLQDYSNWNNDGIRSGTAALNYVSPGFSGECLSFDGTGSYYITIPDTTSIDIGTSDLTIGCWIKTTSTKSNNTIIDKRSGNIGYHFVLYSGTPLIQISDGNSYANFWGGYNAKKFNDGNWHFIAATVDRNSTTGVKIYGDGILLGTYNPINIQGSLSNTTSLDIGHHKTLSSYDFAGMLDEVQIYNNALSASQISALHEIGVPSYTDPDPGIIPPMSSNNGVVGEASASLNSQDAWKAFDGNSTTWWRVVQSGPWINFNFDSPQKITYYLIEPHKDGSTPCAPRNWYLQGWTGQYWETIDVRINITWGSHEYTWGRKFNVANPGTFYQYRLLCKANNHPAAPVYGIRKLKFYTGSVPTSLISQSGSAGMIKGDPNLDPYWNWTTYDGFGHTMYYSVTGTTPQKVEYIQLPFFIGGHVLNTSEKDMYSQDGWQLVYRDFGTSLRANAMPFFVLYNRYRGIFRLMFYNAPGLSFNYYQAAVTFKDPDKSGGILTFSNDTKYYTSEYQKDQEDVFISYVAISKGWGFADFVFAGYDPDMHPETTMRVELRGFNGSDIDLSGTLSLEEILRSQTPATSGKKGINKIVNAIKSGKKYYDEVSSAIDSITTEVEKDENKDKWWATAAQSILSSGLTSISPIAGGLAGFVTSFIGGKNKTSSREPMKFKGELALSGSLTSLPFYIWHADFALKRITTTDETYLPLRTIDWGIFQLEDQIQCMLQCTKFRSNIGLYLYYSTLKTSAIPRLVTNPSCGMTLANAEVALLYPESQNKEPTPYKSTGIDLHAEFPAGQEVLANTSFNDNYVFEKYRISEIAVKLTYKINSAVKYSDQEIVFYRSYPIDYCGFFIISNIQL